MKYTKADTGRVFVVRFDHGDDFLEKLKEIIREEEIFFSTITFLGALSGGEMVCGPVDLKVPASPVEVSFDDGREVLGWGTIVSDGSDVKPHLHSSVGKGEEALVGCLRRGCEVFITVEAVITEIRGADISREKDPRTGHETLSF
ncbi:MAG: DNA-binding protein [Candidatus Tantalella remota]|nr:DNA-binding protein [Candidatus Tantalella remota]